MARKRVGFVLALLAALAWAALIWFMNTTSPEGEALVLFLALVALAMLLTSMPISLWMTYRWGTTRGMRGDVLRALRHGALVGGLTAGLFGLRMLQLLTLPSAVLLIAAVITTEAVVLLKGS